MIAREHAQAAGINRQRFVQAELRREVRDQHLRLVRMLLSEPPVLLAMRLEPLVHALEVRDISLVRGGGGELRLRDRPKQLHRVVIDLFPQLAIEPAKQLDGVRMPDPPEVVRQLQQRLERAGDVREDLKCANVGDVVVSAMSFLAYLPV